MKKDLNKYFNNNINIECKIKQYFILYNDNKPIFIFNSI